MFWTSVLDEQKYPSGSSLIINKGYDVSCPIILTLKGPYVFDQIKSKGVTDFIKEFDMTKDGV